MGFIILPNNQGVASQVSENTFLLISVLKGAYKLTSKRKSAMCSENLVDRLL